MLVAEDTFDLADLPRVLLEGQDDFPASGLSASHLDPGLPSAYSFAPLGDSPTAIRVLEVESDNWYEPVRGTLRVVDLNDEPRFTALSYVWGDPLPPCDAPENSRMVSALPLQECSQETYLL